MSSVGQNGTPQNNGPCSKNLSNVGLEAHFKTPPPALINDNVEIELMQQTRAIITLRVRIEVAFDLARRRRQLIESVRATPNAAAPARFPQSQYCRKRLIAKSSSSGLLNKPISEGSRRGGIQLDSLRIFLFL